MLERLQRFFKLESSSGILLFCCALLAMIFANSSFNSFYFDFLDIPVKVQFSQFIIDKSLLHWINDGFMAVFFVLVGLEVKAELAEGSLSSYQKAIFPALAAFGGMIVPALVYYLITQSHPELQRGWAIPMATDIAFALGIVALLGSRVPLALKIFLLALAIIDDIGAIVVIALFFSDGLSLPAISVATLAIIGLIALNHFKIGHLCAYLLFGLILWASVLKSGVHATLAGVILGFCIPLKDKNGQNPSHQLVEILSPWCAFFVLPLFAFANAGVYFGNINPDLIFSALPVGIALGLIVGKTLGVFSFSYIAVLLRIAKLPDGIHFRQIFAIAVLCGIGFTMSMFLASLAFEDQANGTINTLSRLGILTGSCISAVLGYVLLRIVTKKNA